MSNCCVICYEVSGPPFSSNTKIKIETHGQFGNDNDGTGQKEQEKVKRFFKLLGRHLEVESGGNSFKSKWFQILEQLLSKGDFLPCEKCSEVVHSFCQLYQQLKRIEVKLNGKLSMLNDILKDAEETPERVKDFQERVKQLELDASASLPNGLTVNGNERKGVLFKEISSLRSDLLYKCGRKLSSATDSKLRMCKDKPRPLDEDEDNQLSPEEEIKRNVEVVDDNASEGQQKDAIAVSVSPPEVELQIDTSYSLASNVKVEQIDYVPAAAGGHELRVDEGNNNTTAIIESEIFIEETEQIKVEAELGDDVDPLSLDGGDPLACEPDFDSQMPEMMEHEDNKFNETLEQEDPSQSASAPVIKSILYCINGEAAIVIPENNQIEVKRETVEGADDDDHYANVILKQNPASNGTRRVLRKRKVKDTRTSLRLRNVYRCTKCMKTFSAPEKLSEHEASHEDDDKEWDRGSSSASSNSSWEGEEEDALENDEDPPSGSGSEYNSDNEPLSEEDEENGTVAYPPASIRPSNSKFFHGGSLLSTEVETSEVPHMLEQMTWPAFRTCHCGKRLFSEAEYQNHQKFHENLNNFFCGSNMGSPSLPLPKPAPPPALDPVVQQMTFSASSTKGTRKIPSLLRMMEQASRPRLRTVHPCSKCRKLFATTRSLVEHQRLHHGIIEGTQPSLCGNTRGFQLPRKQFQVPTTRLSTSCKICSLPIFGDDNLSLSRNLQLHYEGHERSGTIFADASPSPAVDTVGSAPTLLKCDWKDCPATFRNTLQLQAHIFRAHGMERRFLGSSTTSSSTSTANNSNVLKRKGLPLKLKLPKIVGGDIKPPTSFKAAPQQWKNLLGSNLKRMKSETSDKASASSSSSSVKAIPKQAEKSGHENI